MPNKLYDRYGPWKPFDRPIPVPFDRWDGTPSWCLTMSDEWAGYVVGAIQALYHDQTWDTDDRETLDDLHYQVSDLMDAIGPDCGLTWSLPSWRMKVIGGTNGYMRSLFYMTEEGYHREQLIVSTIYLQLAGRQIPNETLWAGGKFVAAQFVSSSAEDLIQVTAHDCLDNLIVDNAAGQWNITNIGLNRQLKDLTLVSTGPGFWYHQTAEFPDCEEI